MPSYVSLLNTNLSYSLAQDKATVFIIILHHNLIELLTEEEPIPRMFMYNGREVRTTYHCIRLYIALLPNAIP